MINIIYTLLINFETTSYFVWNQKCYKCTLHVTFLEAYEGSMRNIFWCIKVCIPIWQNTKFKTHAPVSILIRFKDQWLQWVVLILNILLKQNLHMEPQQVKRQRFVLLTNFIGKYIFNIMILYWHFCLWVDASRFYHIGFLYFSWFPSFLEIFPDEDAFLNFAIGFVIVTIISVVVISRYYI